MELMMAGRMMYYSLARIAEGHFNHRVWFIIKKHVNQDNLFKDWLQ